MSTSPIARRIEVLSQIPLFSAFNRDELEALAGRFVDVSYRRGDTVCAEGDEGDTFFVCVSGELEVWGGAPRRIVNRLGAPRRAEADRQPARSGRVLRRDVAAARGQAGG